MTPRLYGRMRMGGNIIWATDFREETKTTTQGGGKGGGGGKVRPPSISTTPPSPLALCEGPITGIGRIWPTASRMDLSGVTWRWYPGDEAQAADRFIAAKMGASEYPGLSRHGLCRVTRNSRCPPMATACRNSRSEVFRPLADPDTAEGTDPRRHHDPGLGRVHLCDAGDPPRPTSGRDVPENLNALANSTDMVEALTGCRRWRPRSRASASWSPWFGDDLRAGSCKVRPGVEGVGQVNHARQLVGQRRQPRQCLPRQPRRSGPPRFMAARRPTSQKKGGAGHPGDEGARTCG